MIKLTGVIKERFFRENIYFEIFSFSEYLKNSWKNHFCKKKWNLLKKFIFVKKENEISMISIFWKYLLKIKNVFQNIENFNLKLFEYLLQNIEIAWKLNFFRKYLHFLILNYLHFLILNYLNLLKSNFFYKILKFIENYFFLQNIEISWELNIFWKYLKFFQIFNFQFLERISENFWFFFWKIINLTKKLKRRKRRIDRRIESIYLMSSKNRFPNF